MPAPSHLVRRVPLVRGLVRLFAALAPLFRGAGVAGRGERLLLLTALLAPLSLIFLPHSASLPLGVGTGIVLLAWMLRGRTLFLHGAEHRAIAAAEQRRLTARAVKPSAAPQCGTNLRVPSGSIVADRLWPLPTASTPFAVTLVSLALTMELWQPFRPRAPGSRGALLLARAPARGGARPRTTRATGVTAVASVLQRELAQRSTPGAIAPITNRCRPVYRGPSASHRPSALGAGRTPEAKLAPGLTARWLTHPRHRRARPEAPTRPQPPSRAVRPLGPRPLWWLDRWFGRAGRWPSGCPRLARWFATSRGERDSTRLMPPEQIFRQHGLAFSSPDRGHATRRCCSGSPEPTTRAGFNENYARS
jgi:hypothetical protein